MKHIKIRKFLLFFLVTPLLVSCGEEGALWHMVTSDSDKTQYFENICEAYGYKYGTPAMAQCVTLEKRSSSSAAADKFARGMQNMQNNMNNRFNDAPVTTNCQRWGSGINCTSY